MGDIMSDLLMAKYPLLSKLWCGILIIFVLTFEANYLLSYVLFIVIIVYVLNMPNVMRITDKVMQPLFWNHPNPYLKEHLAIKTSS